jgi:hypothetical protein
MLFNGHLAPRILIDHSLPPGSFQSALSASTTAKFLCSMNADESRHLALFINVRDFTNIRGD